MANSDTRSPRFVQWLAFLVFSIITLGSVVEVVSQKKCCSSLVALLCTSRTAIINHEKQGEKGSGRLSMSKINNDERLRRVVIN